jgi:hypothetical protein
MPCRVVDLGRSREGAILSAARELCSIEGFHSHLTQNASIVGDAMTFDARAIFEAELSQRGVSFEMDEEAVYKVQVGRWTVSASLENVGRNAEREGDPSLIVQFVDQILAFSGDHPSWDEARRLLFWAAESAQVDFDDAIQFEVSDEVRRVLTLTDDEQSKVAFVTPSMCNDWGVSVEDACAAASANQDRLLDGIELETDGDGDPLETLGMIPIHPPYKASTIFASTFKPLVEPALGWPVLVVLPCRDFVYVIADGSRLLGKLGSVVVKEFKNSGYPITTEVLRVSDDGIEAIGRFPT